MRSTSVKVSVSTALVVVLLSAVPAEAGQSNNFRAPRESPATRMVHTIRQVLAETFGFAAQALPTISIPAPSSPSKDQPL